MNSCKNCFYTYSRVTSVHQYGICVFEKRFSVRMANKTFVFSCTIHGKSIYLFALFENSNRWKCDFMIVGKVRDFDKTIAKIRNAVKCGTQRRNSIFQFNSCFFSVLKLRQLAMFVNSIKFNLCAKMSSWVL